MPDKATTPSILVPVEFSPCSEAALLFAAELAAGSDTPITVLHVVHDPGDAPGYYRVTGRKKHLRRMRDVAGDMLEAFVDRMARAHSHTKVIRQATQVLVTGLPVSRILEIVEEVQPVMVVIGSQGRTGLERSLVGSKAEQIMRLCKVPVTIVKARDGAQEHKKGKS